jgi:hypothetical protein
MLLLDDTSAEALVVDRSLPPAASALHGVLAAEWPRLSDRVRFVTAAIETVVLQADDVVVSSHGCGSVTDVVLDRAAAAGARVAVLPCCHDLGRQDVGPLIGWLDGPLAVDVMRAVALERRGYRVWTQSIPAEITPKHRVILGEPIAS